MMAQLEISERMDISTRLLQKSDLTTADHIFRLGFGTFIGLPEPMMFGGDADYIHTRWVADPTAAFGAEIQGKLVGSVFVTNWGSVGFFGPLTVNTFRISRESGKLAIVLLRQPRTQCSSKNFP